MGIIHALQRLHGPVLDRIMLLVTQLGSEQAYIILLLAAYLGFDALVGRRLAVTFLAGFYLNQQLKMLFDTPRPFELDPAVRPSQAALDTALGSGFPSGHAQSSTTFWGLVAVYARRTWVSVAAALVIVLVCLSRLYLGVHLPIDVLGGIAVGALVVGAGLALDRVAWRLSPAVVVALGLAGPLALQLLAPTPDSGVMLGAMAAFLTGPELVRHRASGGAARRVAVVLLGVVLVFAVQIGSSLSVPDAVRHSTLGSFVRYLLVGWAGLLVTPLLARWWRLAPAAGG